MRVPQRIALLASIAYLAAGSAHAQGTAAAAAFPSIAPSEQATRDNDRLRILQDELRNEQQKAIEQTKRRAERLAARDTQGAQDAEASHARSLANIAALQREIANASTAKQPKAKVAAASASPVASRSASPPAPSSVEAPAHAPWWDVYSKSPRRAAPVAVTQATAQVATESTPTSVTAELAR